MTFVYLGRLEYQTARAITPYQYQQRSANADWGIPNHFHSCGSFVESLSGLQKEPADVKCVFI